VSISFIMCRHIKGMDLAVLSDLPFDAFFEHGIAI
jgi:hypothetical protein